jgi:hypothetical protein
MRTSLSFLGRMCGLLTLISVAARAESIPFAVGQEWSYRTRADEPDSRVVVLRIDEPTGGKRIVHVAVLGLRWKHSKDPLGEEWQMGHAPFAEPTLRASVRELKATRTAEKIPDFAESYAKWEKLGPVGKRPCWTISVLRTVEAQVARIKRERGL